MSPDLSPESWRAECLAHRETLFQLAGVLGMHAEKEEDGTMLMPCGSDLLAEARASQLKLKAIGEYMRNLGTATGDWSVASPVLEILLGDL
jgi:hypothetical protein